MKENDAISSSEFTSKCMASFSIAENKLNPFSVVIFSIKIKERSVSKIDTKIHQEIETISRTIDQTLCENINKNLYFIEKFSPNEIVIAVQLNIEPEWCQLSHQENRPPSSMISGRLARIIKKTLTHRCGPEHLLDRSVELGAAVMDIENARISEVQFATLLRLARKSSKKNGRENIAIVNHRDLEFKRKRKVALRLVRQALNSDRIQIHFQPIVCFPNSNILRMEVLMRIQHPKSGYIYPLDFIPYVLNHDIIFDVGLVVFAKALGALEAWNKEGRKYKLSINVSVRQLQNKDFALHFLTLLTRFPSVSSYQFSIELLESGEITDFSTVVTNLEILKRAGIFCYLDDFGTGSATFSYLKKLPLAGLKIDKLFTLGMLSNEKDIAIVKSIIGIANAFNLEVVAEGVESIEMAEMLNVLGCSTMQGFAILKPTTKEAFDIWVNT